VNAKSYIDLMIGENISAVNRATTVSSTVAQRLHGMIVSGEFAPGTRLPSIPELAKRFGISIAGVREALAALEAAGLIDIRQGQGTFVRDRPPTRQLLAGWLGFDSNPEELRGLIEARQVVEVHLAGVAAMRATSEDLARIAAAVKTMRESQLDIHSFTEADIRFHLSVAEAAHSPVLYRTLEALTTVLRRQILMNIEENFGEVHQLEDSVRRHHAVGKAIAAKDSEDAKRAMAAIIDRAQEIASRRTGREQ